MTATKTNPPAGRIITNQMQADVGKLLLDAAITYDSDVEAIGGQKGENSLDAEATQVVFEIDVPNDQIIVTDNGVGVVGYMKPDDREMGDEWMHGPREVEWEVIAARMSPSSRQSFECLMRYIARSRKPQDGKQKGKMGIGALSHLQVADDCVIYSLPSEELQRDAGIRLQPGECFVLHPPTREQLEANQLGHPPIVRVQRELKAVGMRNITHGTQLVITRLHEGVARSLDPKELAIFLGTRFGGDIRDKGVRIIVYDRTTPEGRKHPGGIPIEVKPPEYRGNCIIDEELKTTHGKQKFRVQLYYSTHHKGNRSPMLRRAGSDFQQLGQLSERLFKGFPWTALEGYVEVTPDMPLTANKSALIQSSRGYLHWINRLKELTAELEEKIEEIEKKARSRSAGRLGKEIAEAALAAMSQVEVFAKQEIGILPREKKNPSGKRTKKRVLQVRKHVEVAVLDENDEPVADNVIQLLRGDRLIDTKTTGASGYVDFGRQPLGLGYRVVLAKTAPCCVADGKTEHGFDLKPDEPGHRHVFNVKTGRKPKGKPQKKLNRRFQVWVHPFPDADPERVLFRDRLPAAIEVNEANRHIAAALDRSDFGPIDALVAFGVATRISNWSFEGRGSDFISDAAAQLFAVTREVLEEKHRGKRKKKGV